MGQMQEIIHTLTNKQAPDLEMLCYVLETDDEAEVRALHEAAREASRQVFGTRIFIRGLIEFTNYCKNDCYYCGIRRENRHADRYRLTEEEILSCCETGYALGFRTFVLQGGEDPYFTDEKICGLVSRIRQAHPDCAVTLSIGEKSKESYRRYFEAGAERYLLRHETADPVHYARLHPAQMSYKNRMRCLDDLMEIGYQTGCGFMVGSPYQTAETLLADLKFIRRFKPHMVGIGPFIPHKDTQYKNKSPGTLSATLRLLSVIRLLDPEVLLPATTALGTIDPTGREQGVLAGANVVMPNLSPVCVRDKYSLYDNKICTGEEAAECIGCLTARMERIGYQIACDRGDHPSYRYLRGGTRECMIQNR